MPFRAALHRMRHSAIGERIAASPYAPHNWRASLRVSRLLWVDYGHLQSVITRSAIDGAGNPVPWYTYPAIHYLRQLNVADRTVFEYGSGNSTLYWSAVAREVVSVENNERWYKHMQGQVPANCRLIYQPDLAKFAATIHDYSEPFDIIVVDGPARGRTRLKCARAAVDHLRVGGLIILDNADWLPCSAQLLRESGLLQVDMTGFAPISAHTQTTSLFFHRAFDIGPHGARQPEPGPGARQQLWESTPSALRQPAVEWEGQWFEDVSFDERVTLTTPAGPRTFRVLVSQSGGESALAILDVDGGRVVLSWYYPDEGRTTTLAAAHAAAREVCGMSWDQLRGFVNSSRKRHLVL